MKRLYILTLLFCASIFVFAQKPEKVMSSSVFKAMDTKVQADIDSEMDKAEESFKKILAKEDNAMSHFGLSVVYSYDAYSKHDFFEAWKHFKIAEENASQLNEDQIAVLNEYFFKQDKRRRNRPLNKNIEWERNLVEEKLIKFVREENNVEYADKFLAEFPDSKYKENVMHIRTYIEYRIAENTNTVESYNSFLQKYPDAAQNNMAIRNRNSIAYKNAVALNSLSALKAFAKQYPDAEQIEDAYKLMSLLAYDEAVKVHTLAALEQFMKEYPNSTKMPDAKILKKQLLFEWAKSVNTIAAYNQFVALYPEGSYYIDIFNLKAAVLGQQLLMDFPMENYMFVRGYDNQEFSDFGGSIIQRSNGELVLIVNSKRNKDEMYDNWLLGLDANGKMLWNSFLGNKFDDFANKAVTNSLNEIFVAGTTNAILDSIEGQTWLYKMAADGTNVYNTKLEGNGVLGLGLFDNGEVVIGSYTTNMADSSIVPLLIKVNKNGKKLWSRTYSATGKVYDLSVNNNITYLTTGSWICALNEMGYLIWDAFFSEGEYITAVKAMADGTVIFAGKKGAASYAVAYNAQGTKVWEQTYASQGIGNIQKINILTDGSILLSGTFGNGIGVTKITTQGALVSQKDFSLPNGISLNDIISLENNTVVISATRLGGASDIIVFKMGF